MSENTRMNQLSQQFGGNVQLPIPIVVLVCVILLALFAGAFAPGAGLAIVAIGALAALIADFMAWQHAEFGQGAPASKPAPTPAPTPVAPAEE